MKCTLTVKKHKNECSMLIYPLCDNRRFQPSMRNTIRECLTRRSILVGFTLSCFLFSPWGVGYYVWAQSAKTVTAEKRATTSHTPNAFAHLIGVALFSGVLESMQTRTMEYKRRLDTNPEDAEVKEILEEIERQKKALIESTPGAAIPSSVFLTGLASLLVSVPSEGAQESDPDKILSLPKNFRPFHNYSYLRLITGGFCQVWTKSLR